MIPPPIVPPPAGLVAQTLRSAASHIRRTSWNPDSLYLDDQGRRCGAEEAAAMCLQGAIRLAAYELVDGRDSRYHLITAAHHQLSLVTGGHITGYQRQPGLTQEQVLTDLERAAAATDPPPA